MATKYLCPKCRRKHNHRSSAVSCCNSGATYSPGDVYVESIWVSDSDSGSSCGGWGGGSDSSSSSCDSGGGGD